MRRSTVVIHAIAFAAALGSGSTARCQTTTVSLANLAAPGIDGAVVYQFSNSANPGQASLDNLGRSAFLGRMLDGVAGVTADDDTGVWSEGGGQLALVAREGSQAPGIAAGGVFAELSRDPVLNERGEAAFAARLREGVGGVTATNNAGFWAQRNGVLELVARTGNAAPGTPAGTSFASFPASTASDGFFAFNNLGHTAFNASLAVGGGSVTSGNDTGIWADTGDGLALIAREGAPAPEAAAGAVFEDLTSYSETPALNHRGQLAFTAQLRNGPGGVTSGNDFGIWTASDGAVRLAIGEGASAPTPAGGVFRHFSEVQINDAGSLLFRGLLVPGPGGVGSTDDEALWLRRGGSIELVAREGSQVPGAPAGAKYGSFSFYALNNQSRAAASGYLQVGGGGVTAENNAALWSGPPGNARVVARENELAPGALGAVFADFFTPNINTAGQVAFMATLKGDVGGVTASSDRGVWATDITGALHLVAREGNPIEVAPGDVRTITQLGFRGNSGNADGRYSMFNDFGQVQFWAQLGESEGLFISDRVKRDPAASDFDQNGEVNAADLALWSTGFGKALTATPMDGDANGDLIVDGADFLAWQRQAGGSGAATVAVGAVPEPTATALFAGLLLPLARRGRNNRGGMLHSAA